MSNDEPHAHVQLVELAEMAVAVVPGSVPQVPVDLGNDSLVKVVNWVPETIDWADYWVNIHTKGIEKWIRPMFTTVKKTAG